MTQSASPKQGRGQLSSPEQLNDYLHVTNPKVWLLLAAIIMLIIGLFVWSTVTSLNSFVAGTAVAKNHELTITFPNKETGKYVQAGMTVEIGENSEEIASVGTDSNGQIVASAQMAIPDGTYDARVIYKSQQVASMLFN